MFVDAGAKVVVADINGEGAERVAAGVRERGGVAHSVTADIRTAEGIAAMVEAADQLGGADALVNNAGGDFRTSAAGERPVCRASSMSSATISTRASN